MRIKNTQQVVRCAKGAISKESTMRVTESPSLIAGGQGNIHLFLSKVEVS